ncbi:unnamed protein product [Chondrus crispus]|uniref:Uncharacterized protein n=1 Tax=Chondrus crispus TaxID=2769 RepID=R7QB15_CHOCR|nr:unnamed protein product [Chondrus crispus]CDF35264.1 unnamed protein product [Chondrus crispus]|eukprot:XP_005715083.1 unnamed protein product [Chondrus crispus]
MPCFVPRGIKIPSVRVVWRYCASRCSSFQWRCVGLFSALASVVAGKAMSGLLESAMYLIAPFAVLYMSGISSRVVSSLVGGSTLTPSRYGVRRGLFWF